MPTTLSELWSAFFEERSISLCPTSLTSDYRQVGKWLDRCPIQDLNEADYNGKNVQLNRPMRNSGGNKKYVVYVKNPSSGKVKKISFGDVHGGLTAKVSNAQARKSFAARHQCHNKKDKTKAGYWACRINRYGHLWGGKTYPGYW